MFSPVDPVWVFLAPGRLAAKTPVYEGWKGLDFLGFSRQNRAFSMGYTAFSLEEISRALFAVALDTAPERKPALLACEREGCSWGECSWGKLNSVSDFLQEIAVRTVSAASIQSNSL
jgi:hypothetical protein